MPTPRYGSTVSVFPSCHESKSAFLCGQAGVSLQNSDAVECRCNGQAKREIMGQFAVHLVVEKK